MLDEGDVLAKLVETLEESRRGVKRWEVAGDDWDALEVGVRRIYKRGFGAFHEATEAPTDEGLQEWRKRVKDFWYVMEILKPIRPGYTGRRAEEAHKLADLLGDDHDLAVLRGALSAAGDEADHPASPGVLLPLIEARRAELRRDAFGLGPVIYGERPRAFVARIGAYWRAWRSEAEAAGFDQP